MKRSEKTIMTTGGKPGSVLRPLLLTTVILLLTVFLCAGMPASVRAAASESDGKKLVIEVVEELPADEIEEAEVPLAALPDTEARETTRHILLAGLFLAASVTYVVYFSKYDKKLYLLRKEAAQAEKDARNRRRGETI